VHFSYAQGLHVLRKLFRFEGREEHDPRLVHPQVVKLAVALLNVTAHMLEHFYTVHARHLEVQQHQLHWGQLLNDALGHLVARSLLNSVLD